MWMFQMAPGDLWRPVRSWFSYLLEFGGRSFPDWSIWFERL